VYIEFHSRRSLDTFSVQFRASGLLPPNPCGIISFADPHPLTLLESYRFKNMGRERPLLSKCGPHNFPSSIPIPFYNLQNALRAIPFLSWSSILMGGTPSPQIVTSLLPYFVTSSPHYFISSCATLTAPIGGRRMPTRENAWKLLCEYTASESLRKHMLAVEACVRAYARKTGADEETWGLAALLHDFDYERWPNQEHSPDKGHPSEGAKILREQGYSKEVVRAIITHADYCGMPRQSALEHTLFACDELAGFLTACAYVRPSKSILDLEVDSVKRRMKDKLFAKGVSRDDVRKGAEELGVPLEEHIGFCIAALRKHADALGLRGTL
jgi:putative nucleotidyltransferase with HDIG domain